MQDLPVSRLRLLRAPAVRRVAAPAAARGVRGWRTPDLGRRAFAREWRCGGRCLLRHSRVRGSTAQRRALAATSESSSRGGSSRRARAHRVRGPTAPQAAPALAQAAPTRVPSRTPSPSRTPPRRPQNMPAAAAELTKVLSRLKHTFVVAVGLFAGGARRPLHARGNSLPCWPRAAAAGRMFEARARRGRRRGAAGGRARSARGLSAAAPRGRGRQQPRAPLPHARGAAPRPPPTQDATLPDCPLVYASES